MIGAEPFQPSGGPGSSILKRGGSSDRGRDSESLHIIDINQDKKVNFTLPSNLATSDYGQDRPRKSKSKSAAKRSPSVKKIKELIKKQKQGDIKKEVKNFVNELNFNYRKQMSKKWDEIKKLEDKNKKLLSQGKKADTLEKQLKAKNFLMKKIKD